MSFIVAGRLGADYIEFDVVLTKDRIPVIFHDFDVKVSVQEEVEPDGRDQMAVGIHQMTWRQLSRLKTGFKAHHPSKVSCTLVSVNNVFFLLRYLIVAFTSNFK
jgi:glycerophosphoryl diester phosphodiesterase